MPTELEELVEFLHHGNTQIRQVAAENLLPYTKSDPALFWRNQLEPIKDLKLLIKDYEPIKKNAITMLINLSGDKVVREFLATDDEFLETLLLRVISPKDPHADLASMLLANLSKSPSLTRLTTLQLPPIPSLSQNSTTTTSSSSTSSSETKPSTNALDALTDIFVRSSPLSPASSRFNPSANYDYLAYVFADLASSAAGSTYLTTPQPGESFVPLQKLLPFTAVDMPLPRRLGVASAIKNTAFGIPPLQQEHVLLDGDGIFPLDPPVNLLTYILLPLASGSDVYDDEETDALLEDLQLLDADVKRDADTRVLATHLETLLILASLAEGRKKMREAGTYYVVRELHKAVDDEDVAMACDRLVQVLQRGEPEGEEGKGDEGKVREITGGGGDDDDDDDDDDGNEKEDGQGEGKWREQDESFCPLD